MILNHVDISFQNRQFVVRIFNNQLSALFCGALTSPTVFVLCISSSSVIYVWVSFFELTTYALLANISFEIQRKSYVYIHDELQFVFGVSQSICSSLLERVVSNLSWIPLVNRVVKILRCKSYRIWWYHDKTWCRKLWHAAWLSMEVPCSAWHTVSTTVFLASESRSQKEMNLVSIDMNAVSKTNCPSPISVHGWSKAATQSAALPLSVLLVSSNKCNASFF